MILNRSTKIFIAVVTLMAAVFLIAGHVVNNDPVSDWTLALILAVISAVTWFWLWQSEVVESRELMVIDDDVRLPMLQEWVIEKVQDIPKAPAAKSPTAAAAKGEPDDLTRVEGIGPKYRDALVKAGISTFARLAACTPEQIEQAVAAAGMRRTASMETWAEQAKLAAKGDWTGLEKLQSELSGGRR